jgi:hypothetical protein
LLALDPVPDIDGGWAASCEVAESWAEVKAAVRRPAFRVVTQQELYSVEDAQEQLEVAVRIVRAPEVGRCVLMIDELSPYFRKGREAPESIQGLVRFGRRQGVSCLLISQRAYDCPVEVRSQLTDLFVFRLVERDVEHLSQFIGRRNVEQIVELGRFEHLHFDLTRPGHVTHNRVAPARHKEIGDGSEARALGDGDRGGDLLGGREDSLDPGQRPEERDVVGDPDDTQENDE